RALIVAVSIADAKKSPTFCRTEPAAPGCSAASSTIVRSAAQFRSASSLKPPQRDLSAGIFVSAYHRPAANRAKSSPGETAKSIRSTLNPGSTGSLATSAAIAAAPTIDQATVIQPAAVNPREVVMRKRLRDFA